MERRPPNRWPRISSLGHSDKKPHPFRTRWETRLTAAEWMIEAATWQQEFFCNVDGRSIKSVVVVDYGIYS
jgi:hypothetical protein